MSRDFKLPDLGEGLTEAEIVKVLVREGDVIAEDAPLLEVETDKAQVEIPSPMAGRVERVHVQPGQTVKVGAVLVSFADANVVRRRPRPRRAAPPRRPPRRRPPLRPHPSPRPRRPPARAARTADRPRRRPPRGGWRASWR